MRYREHLMRMDAARQELKVLFARLTADQLKGVSRTYAEACVTHDLMKTLPIPTASYKDDAESLHAQFRELITYAKETLAMTQDYVAQAFAKVQATLPADASYWQEPEPNTTTSKPWTLGDLFQRYSPDSRPSIAQGEFKMEPGLDAAAPLNGGLGVVGSFYKGSGVIKTSLTQNMMVEWYRKNPDSMPEEEFLARMTGRAFDLADGRVVIVDSMEADCQWTAEQIESMLPPILKDIVETPTYRPMNAVTHKLHELVLRLHAFRDAVDFENNLRVAKRERHLDHAAIMAFLTTDFPQLNAELKLLLFTYGGQIVWESVKYLEGAGFPVSYFKAGHAKYDNQVHLYLTRGYIVVKAPTVQ